MKLGWHTKPLHLVGIWIALSLLTGNGCVQPVVIDMDSFDPAQDQMAIAGYYREEAVGLHQKAAALVESADRYERLFGPQSDWVTGARHLSQYYAAASQDLDRRADAHAEAARMARQLPR